jgi:hypothetical protein
MTVATTNTSELDIGQIILQAYQQAGLMELSQSPSGPQWDAKAAFARGCLSRTVQKLGAEGPFMRETEFYTITLTQGTSAYDLPADTIDVVAQGAYKPVSSTDTVETTIRQIDREEWNQTPDKVSQSIPFRMFVNRGSTVTVNFLQVPPETGATVRIQRQKLLADIKSNADTVDLERYWIDALVWEVAHMAALAASLPIERCGYFKSQAKDARELAKAKARQQTPNTIHFNHPTGWGR